MHWNRRHRLGRPPHPDVLTPAEWRVLELVREGHPNAEIAHRLGIAMPTVKTHVSRLLAKTGSADRAALMAWDGEPAEASREALARRGPLPLLGWLTAAGSARGATIVAASVVFVGALLLLTWQFDDVLLDDARTVEPGSFEDMLRFVPDTGPPRGTVLIDSIERYRQIVGVDTPAADRTAEGDIAYMDTLAAASDETTISLMPRFQFPALRGPFRYAYEHTPAWLGLGLASVDQMITADRANGDFAAFRGRFDIDQVLEHLERCGDCPEHQRLEHRGWKYLAWGEGAVSAQSATEPFTLEALSRLALHEGYAMHADTTEILHAAIDAREGVESLSDYEPFSLLAAELDRMGSVDATIMDTSQDPATWTLDNIAGPLARDLEVLADAFSPQAMTVLRPYVATGLGRGIDDDERPFAAVVLAHEDAATAEENVGRIEQRFAEWQARGFFAEMNSPTLGLFGQREYDDIEVERSGRVVSVRLYGGGGAPFLLSSVPLFLHEPR